MKPNLFISFSSTQIAKVGHPFITGNEEGTKLNKTSELNCTSCGGIPAPVIHWQLEGLDISQSNVTYSTDGICTTDRIHFKSLEVYDRDRLVCTADNGVGDSKSINATVRLQTNGTPQLVHLALKTTTSILL